MASMVAVGAVAVANVVGVGSAVRVIVEHIDEQSNTTWVRTADLRDAGARLPLNSGAVSPEPQCDAALYADPCAMCAMA